MKLSIITINYNNAPGLEETITSIVSQSFRAFEFIVIDGGSTGEDVDVIKKYADNITYWVSEPDLGIYNAMNKGIKQAKGDYVLFINSGDTLFDRDVLSKIDFSDATIDLLYGDLQRIYPDNSSDIVKMPEVISTKYMLENTLAHPVCFIKKSLFEKYGLYREDLKIVSDWAFFLQIIASREIKYKHIPVIISSFRMGGMSNDPENNFLIKSETDKVIKELFTPEELQKYTDARYYNLKDQKALTKRNRISRITKRLGSFSFWNEVIHRRKYYGLIRFFNKTVKQQEKDPLSIPIIIISYNRLNDLKKLVTFLLERKHKNIIIADNQSSYPPLLEYYNQIKDRVTIRVMDKNYGHLAFWLNSKLLKEYGKGYYIVTDPDIIPNNKLPDDYLNRMMNVLKKHKEITKVGFALRIDDIPDSYAQKQYVLEWENQFWKKEIDKDVYEASLDTTFALYTPQYRYFYSTFYKAVRMAGNYTARHGGWYTDSKNLSDEEKYYINTASSSSSWKTDEKGSFTNELYIK